MKSKEPVRLQKQSQNFSNQFEHFLNSSQNRIDRWCRNHLSFCLFVSLIMFAVIFTMLIYILVGVSATESGAVYNQFDKII